jgi:hypothetical protein
MGCLCGASPQPTRAFLQTGLTGLGFSGSLRASHRSNIKIAQVAASARVQLSLAHGARQGNTKG